MLVAAEQHVLGQLPGTRAAIDQADVVRPAGDRVDDAAVGAGGHGQHQEHVVDQLAAGDAEGDVAHAAGDVDGGAEGVAQPGDRVEAVPTIVLVDRDRKDQRVDIEI